MKGYTIDCNYLIRVKEYMYKRPKHRSKILINGDEWLPIIHVETEI